LVVVVAAAVHVRPRPHLRVADEHMGDLEEFIAAHERPELTKGFVKSKESRSKAREGVLLHYCTTYGTVVCSAVVQSVEHSTVQCSAV
jgi:hypothetical protein